MPLSTPIWRLTATSSSDSSCTSTATLPITVFQPPNQCGLQVSFGSSAHMANGNLSHSQELFSVRGGALPLGLNLYYNSRDSHNASLGRGWSHDYDVTLKENSDGSVLISEGNMKYEYFTLSNGAYVSPPGYYSTLAKNSVGTFTLTTKEGQASVFNADGAPASITDRNGNATTFAYTSGNLTAVTDPSGRKATLFYDTNNHLTSVTDPAGNSYTFAYSGNTLSSVTYPDGGQWQYTYDPNAFMLTKTDPLGNTTTYAYDDNHRVVSSIDPEGQNRSIAYPVPGTDVTKTTTFTEKDGGVWTYRYDTLVGTLTSKTDPLGGVTSYTYDASGNRTSTTLPDGTTTTSTYDAAGNMTSTTDALGQTTSYTYNAFGQVLTIKDPQGGVTSYTYDSAGNMTAMTDPTGATTQYQYDAKGNVTKVTNPLGQATTFVYDAAGNLTSTTDPAGATTSFTYDGAGNMTSQTDANGATTRFGYDARNRLVKATDSAGNVTTYAYDAAGNKISQTDANGNVTQYEYNARGQVVKVTDALGNATMYTYGGSGCASCGGGTDKLTAVTDANGNTIRYVYDQLGRKTKEIDVLGNTVCYIHDTKGNVLSKTDASGRVATFVYDPLNRVIEQIDPAGGKILFEYLPKGQLTKVTDPIGVATVYEYDALGRTVRTSSPDAGTTTFTYNADGSLKTRTDGNGTTTAYEYDGASRVVAVKYPDSSQDVSYSYDNCPNGKGKVCSMTDSSGTMSYAYDATGRIATERKTIFGINYTTGYTHDKAGNLASITYPSGRTVTYSHDKVNLTSNVTAKLKSTSALASAIGYDLTGNFTALTYGNGLVLSWTYDPSNRVKTIAIPGIMSSAYTYDAGGNITTIADGLNAAASKIYHYDALDRLTSANGPWGNLAWSFDSNGNRLSQKNGTSYSYTYEGNRLVTVTNGTKANYLYNNVGSILSDGTKGFIYNQNNRLIKAVENGKTLGEYVYNGKGERVVKKTGPADTNSASSQNIVYHYDQNGRLIEETTGDGKLLVDYAYLDGKPLAMIRKQGNNEETFYYHNDHLGTPKVMTDKQGKVVWNLEFDPFGNEVQTKGRQGTYIRNVENNLRFPGQYFDSETGLHYNYFRDYNPKNGRYLKADPTGVDAGSNLYSYTGNNPSRFIDPYGLLIIGISPRDIWMGVADSYMRPKGLNISAELLEHSLTNNPSALNNYSGATAKIKASLEYRQFINSIPSGNCTSWTGPFIIEFRTDRDLFAAFQHVKISYKGCKQGSYRNLDIKIEDTYTFHPQSIETSSLFSFLATMGANAAYLYQSIGLITPYDILIQFKEP